MLWKMWYFKFVIFSQILIVIYAGYIQDKLTNSKMIQVVRVDGEGRGKNVAMETFLRGIKSGPWGIAVSNTTTKVKEDLVDNLKASITITRCLARENLDSCEEVHKYKDLDYCQSINPDNIVVNQSPFVMHFQPKFKCPIKKGIYTALNTTLSMTPFLLLQLENVYYRVTFQLFAPKSSRVLNHLVAEARVINKLQ